MSDTTVAILAGGQGSRLGGIDKGLAILADKPLVEWALAALDREDHAGVMIVANRNLAHYRRHATTISDAVCGHAGPLAGISAAMAACPTRWMATVPVDCPTPPTGWISRLREAVAVAGGDSAVAIVGGQRQPLFALYDTSLAQSAAAQLAGDAGVAGWQIQIGTLQVDLTDLPGDWSNLNTALDFRLAEERLRAIE